ncbi:MAG TPA: hypothetical protein DCM87_15900 [Planctomycetes bacterium]|nr:hypothetical protein [Planctomycetota bacterium]
MFCLAVAGFLCVQAPAQQDQDDDVGFRLILINGEPVVYSVASPTDGDILDRGFLARDVILTFRSNHGEAVVCTDRLGVERGRAVRESCPPLEGKDAACFTMAISTRQLPNGPNRLFFTLYDASPGPEIEATALAEIRLVINVLNPRVEVDARKVDGVRLRIEAGVLTPARLKDYRLAVFAGRECGPSRMVEGYVTQDPPWDLRAPVGPEPIKIFPRSADVHSAPWPEDSPYLYFHLSRAALVELSQTPVPRPVYLVMAIFDGKTWHWTGVCEVALPPEGEGKSLPD